MSEKPKNDNAFDDYFWDLGKLMPKKRPERKEPLRTESVTVITGDVPETSGERIPKRSEVFAAPDEVTCEYETADGQIKVRISRISNLNSAYVGGSFMADVRALWRKKCAPCRRVPYFSYMPSYRSMTHEQLIFYLYFRDRARHGEYIETEYSYILLYIFEIINMGGDISAQTGARLIALIWKNYRDAYPALDRTAGEWLCDYCLINGTPVPTEILSPFISGALKSLRNPDVYLGGTAGIRNFETLCAYSSYDYRTSRRYRGSEALFDDHIPAAALCGAKELSSMPLPDDMPTVHTVSRAYTGALHVGDGKKIEVQTRSLLRSKIFCETVSSLIKACENRIRAHLGATKLKLKRPLPPPVAAAVNGYFDVLFADDLKKAEKKAQDEEYLRLYEPENNGKADISRALGIERDAWKTAVELDAENLFQDEETALPELLENGENETEEDPVFSPELARLLGAALDGRFIPACRDEGINPTEAERLINEAAYDFLGDALIEGGELIEDYRSDVETILSGIDATKENT